MLEFFHRIKSLQVDTLDWIANFKKTKDIGFEIAAFFLILIAGVLSRLIFVHAYPSRPTSDFYNIFDLALSFEKDVLAKGNSYWQYFSAGLPFILSILFRVVPYPSEDVARWATAGISGLSATLPFLIWKDIFSQRTRIFCGLLLALWPGQILFSGILAQDNWIIFPTVGLAALAVRVLVRQKGGSPIWAALFYFFAVAIRQEMLIALIPLLAVTVLGTQREKWIRNIAAGSLLLGTLFGVLIIQRGLATGRYALSTNHLGVSILGAYIPGAGLGWISPIPYLQANYPQILDDEDFEQQASDLVWPQFIRRPGFHLIRMAGSSLYNLFYIDKELAPWSLTAEGTLPHRYRKSAKALYESLAPVLQFVPLLIHGLFLSAVFFSFFRRQLLIWISPILLTIAFKIGLHAVIVSQPRYFLVVVALELLVIAIVWDGMLKQENWKLTLRSIFLGVLSVFVLLFIMNSTKEYIEKYDFVSQPNDGVFTHNEWTPYDVWVESDQIQNGIALKINVVVN